MSGQPQPPGWAGGGRPPTGPPPPGYQQHPQHAHPQQQQQQQRQGSYGAAPQPMQSGTAYGHGQLQGQNYQPQYGAPVTHYKPPGQTSAPHQPTRQIFDDPNGYGNYQRMSGGGFAPPPAYGQAAAPPAPQYAQTGQRTSYGQYTPHVDPTQQQQQQRSSFEDMKPQQPSAYPHPPAHAQQLRVSGEGYQQYYQPHMYQQGSAPQAPPHTAAQQGYAQYQMRTSGQGMPSMPVGNRPREGSEYGRAPVPQEQPDSGPLSFQQQQQQQQIQASQPPAPQQIGQGRNPGSLPSGPPPHPGQYQQATIPGTHPQQQQQQHSSMPAAHLQAQGPSNQSPSQQHQQQTQALPTSTASRSEPPALSAQMAKQEPSAPAPAQVNQHLQQPQQPPSQETPPTASQQSMTATEPVNEHVRETIEKPASLPQHPPMESAPSNSAEPGQEQLEETVERKSSLSKVPLDEESMSTEVTPATEKRDSKTRLSQIMTDEKVSKKRRVSFSDTSENGEKRPKTEELEKDVEKDSAKDAPGDVPEFDDEDVAEEPAIPKTRRSVIDDESDDELELPAKKVVENKAEEEEANKTEQSLEEAESKDEDQPKIKKKTLEEMKEPAREVEEEELPMGRDGGTPPPMTYNDRERDRDRGRDRDRDRDREYDRDRGPPRRDSHDHRPRPSLEDRYDHNDRHGEDNPWAKYDRMRSSGSGPQDGDRDWRQNGRGSFGDRDRDRLANGHRGDDYYGRDRGPDYRYGQSAYDRPDNRGSRGGGYVHDTANPGDIPDRWVQCPPMSNGMVPGTPFVAFKAPLSSKFDSVVLENDRWTPTNVIESCRDRGIELGMVIDLTKTSRYYDPQEFERAGVRYHKIACAGFGAPPNEDNYQRFQGLVRWFTSPEGPGEHMAIGVHCTHGFNRTGFLIARYMTELGFSTEAAVQEIAIARDPGIYKDQYIEELFRIAGERRTVPTPDKPAWENYGRVDADDDCNAYEGKPMTLVGVEGEVGYEVRGPERDEVVRRCCHYCHWFQGGRNDFPGSQPVSLDSSKLDLIRRNPYMVSWKADGTRYMMFISGPVVYMLDRDSRVFRIDDMHFPVDVESDEFLTETLLDGEMVIDRPKGNPPRNRYLIYDLITLNGIDIGRTLPFDKRHARVHSAIIKPREKSRNKYDLSKEPFSIRLKDFVPCRDVKKILKVMQQVPHETDGLVFHPVEDHYQAGRCDRLLKWKPPDMNSVDFKLHLREQSGPGMPNTLKGELYVGGAHGRLELHDPPYNTLNLPRAKLKELDGQIVECSWDEGSKQWVFMRIRDDKSYPNGKRTVKGVLRSIKDSLKEPILVDVLINESAHMPLRGPGM
eukprot:Clim_evm92s172 gene=Clim_evmTU92s172